MKILVLLLASAAWLCAQPSAGFRHASLPGTMQITTTLTNHSVTSNWLARLNDAGITPPEQNVIGGLNEFCVALDNAGLWAKMKVIQPFPPGNIAYVTNVFYYGTFSATWTNYFFEDSDLTVDGLAGDGASKCLDTGIWPTNFFSANTNAGITIYVVTNNSNDELDIGCVGNVSPAYVCEFNSSESGAYIRWDAFNFTEGAGRLSYASGPRTGYFSGNRGYGYTFIAFANSETNHAILASGSGAGGVRPNTLTIFVFAENHITMGVRRYTTRTYSFVAFHDGLTEAESSAFYDAIQQLRVSFGGGYK